MLVFNTMEKGSTNKRTLLRIIFLGFGAFIFAVLSIYLKNVYDEEGGDKFIYSLILFSALIVGIAHILLFILRKSIESKSSEEFKIQKRQLEIWRNTVNYITPFVLLAMGYHFWQNGWLLMSILVFVLLVDRINDLLRKNK
jgi:Na+/melibiose symporter-like transporter